MASPITELREKRRKKKLKPLTPPTDEQSINEDYEDFNLAKAMKELIVLDNGKLIENLEAKISNGDYEVKVDAAVEKLKDRKEWNQEQISKDVSKAKSKAI